MKLKPVDEFVVVGPGMSFPDKFFPEGTIVHDNGDSVAVAPPPPLDSMLLRYGQRVYKHLRYVVMAGENE